MISDGYWIRFGNKQNVGFISVKHQKMAFQMVGAVGCGSKVGTNELTRCIMLSISSYFIIPK